MKRNVVVTLATALVTATFIGGAYVGNKAKETQTAYADAVQAVGEAATTEPADEYVPCALNPDCTLPDETEVPEIESDETEISELTADDYINRVSDADAVQVVPCNELTTEMLENRNGKIYIEKMVGIVDDDEGNGHILNPYVDGYNYIMYGGHVDCHKGDIVVTYNVYNPKDNAIDDIIARSDYVVGNVNE